MAAVSPSNYEIRREKALQTGASPLISTTHTLSDYDIVPCHATPVPTPDDSPTFWFGRFAPRTTTSGPCRPQAPDGMCKSATSCQCIWACGPWQHVLPRLRKDRNKPRVHPRHGTEPKNQQKTNENDSALQPGTNTQYHHGHDPFCKTAETSLTEESQRPGQRALKPPPHTCLRL